MTPSWKLKGESIWRPSEVLTHHLLEAVQNRKNVEHWPAVISCWLPSAKSQSSATRFGFTRDDCLESRLQKYHGWRPGVNWSTLIFEHLQAELFVLRRNQELPSRFAGFFAVYVRFKRLKTSYASPSSSLKLWKRCKAPIIILTSIDRVLSSGDGVAMRFDRRNRKT